MAYSGVVRRILISCPGDVPESDLAIVRRAVNRWNGVYGPDFGTAVVPISWGEHAAAEFGQHPQVLLNQQLVDTCDGAIAIFANRLGTPTEAAESGTAEEIQRLADAGKYVAVLRSTRPVDASRLDRAQADSLDQYLKEIGGRALILRYATDDDLSRHADTILAQVVSRDAARAELQLQSLRPAEVWPRVESSERVRTDSRGRVNTSRNWYLVLHNTGDAPARNVRFQLDESSWTIGRDSESDEPDIRILAPNSEIKFPILAHMGMSAQTLCTVSWEEEGEHRSNEATLRLS